MKNKILLIIAFLLLFPLKIYAATGSITASSSQSYVNLNNTFNVTVRVSSTDTLGSWQYNLTYDSSKLTLVSGATGVADSGDGSYKVKTYSYTFRAIAEGVASISINNAAIADFKTVQHLNPSSSGTTVTISKPVNKVYSSDNSLSSLEVEGYELEFDKNKLEYIFITNPGITSVNISARVNHNKATVSGTGLIDLIEGENEVEVSVKAENGALKTYLLKITVPEKDPIKIKYKDEDIFVARKLPEKTPSNFNEVEVVINSEEIKGLYNSKLKLTIIYATNSKGNGSYYIFENGKVVNKFIYITSQSLNIYVPDNNQTLKGMKTYKVNINNEELNILKIKDDSKFYIIYGINTNNNEENFYSYDKVNKTLQVFNKEDYLYNLNKLDIMMIIGAGVSGLLVLITIISILQAKNLKKIKKGPRKEEVKKDKPKEKIEDLKIKKEEPKEKTPENKKTSEKK